MNQNFFKIFALILLATQIYTFTFGFRLTADDVLFAEAYFSGFNSVWDLTKNISQNQGRIGFLILQPINMFAAYYSEYLIMRIVFVGFYFFTHIYALKVVCEIIDRKLFIVSVIIFLSIHPQAFEHLPPNSYPLQNTVPFLLLFFGYRNLRSSNIKLTKLISAILIFISILLTEYAFLVCFSLFLLGMAVDFSKKTTFSDLFKWILDGYNFILFLILLAAFLIYRIYQLNYKSTYQGNTLPAELDFVKIFKVASLHIIDGTSLRRIISFIDIYTFIYAIFFIFLVWIISRRKILHLTYPKTKISRKSFVCINLTIIFVLYLLTLPLSFSSFQIDMCDYNPFCGYLDSRSAFIFLSVFFTFNIFYLTTRISEKLQKLWLTALLLTLGGLSFATLSHNLHVRTLMKENDIIWENAKEASCYIFDTSDGANLAKLIDENNIIPFHTLEMREKFWGKYLKYNNENRECVTNQILMKYIEEK